ncbi:hypothetical protein, partial [Escherichia coli]
TRNSKVKCIASFCKRPRRCKNQKRRNRRNLHLRRTVRVLVGY